MPNCHACRETYVNGEILCSHCGADLDEIKPLEDEAPTTQHLLVVGVQGLVHLGPTIILHVIEVDDMVFPEGGMVATIPIQKLEIPVRIGRTDMSQNPPIIPELNLAEVLADLQPGIKPIVSRLHAALQLDAGRPAIKALTGPNGTTWTRHSGDDRWSPVPPNTVRPLENRDIIVLGHPRSRHVTLRVVIRHP